MPFSSKTFAQAAKIAEQIESLETKLSVLLQGAEPIEQKKSNSKGAITPRASMKRRIALPKKVESAAPNGSSDGRGTLRPAVVAVLKESDKPLKTAGIYSLLRKQKRFLEFASTKCWVCNRSGKDSSRQSRSAVLPAKPRYPPI